MILHSMQLMLQKLEQKNVEFFSKHIQSGILKEGYVEKFADRYKIPLCNWMEPLYTKLNGINIEWSINAPSYISGFFSLETFERSFIHSAEISQGNLWWDEDKEHENFDEIKKHAIFEYMPGIDSYITIKTNIDGSYNMFYVAEGVRAVKEALTLPKIPLTVEQYLDLMISCYGCDGVRHHLHKPEFYQNPFEVCPELQYLKILFPDLKLALPV